MLTNTIHVYRAYALGGTHTCSRVVAVSAPIYHGIHLTTPGASEPPCPLLTTFTDELPHRYPTLHLPTLPLPNRFSHAYDSVSGSSPALFTARLPTKLVAQIENLEYVEMAELL